MPLDAETVEAMEKMMVSELPWLSPVGALVIGAIGAVLLALFVRRDRQHLAAWWAGAWQVAAAGLAVGVWIIGGPRSIMSGSIQVDGLNLSMTIVLSLAGAACVALARPTVARTDREGEFYAMLVAATLAGVVLSGANDIALIALALSLLGIGSFVMTGYLRRSARGGEAAIKYYIFATATGAAMVYGLSWWYGAAGSTLLGEIGPSLAEAPAALVVASTVLVVMGLGYKASVVPFHWWAPDVYDGAPVPVAAYVSVLPKIAALAALARILEVALPGELVGWPLALAVVAALTMALGVLAMIPQRNVVRLLAYSSISQTGFVLIALAALPGSDGALTAFVYYLIAYAASNLAAFAVVMAVKRDTGSVHVEAFAGLGRRHPWWTAALVLSFLSLFGLPPLTGFVAKLTVFAAAIDAGLAWLAVVGIVATVVSLYPYLRVIAPAVVSERERGGRPRLAAAPLAAALGATAAAVVAFGIAAEPLLDMAADSVVIPNVEAVASAGD